MSYFRVVSLRMGLPERQLKAMLAASTALTAAVWFSEIPVQFVDQA